jgi:hypothetical protein
VFPLMLVNKKSSFCLDLRDTQVKPGGRVQLAVCNESNNQRWQNKAAR